MVLCVASHAYEPVAPLILWAQLLLQARIKLSPGCFTGPGATYFSSTYWPDSCNWRARSLSARGGILSGIMKGGGGCASLPILKNPQNELGFARFFAGPFEIARGHSVFPREGKAVIWLIILAAAISNYSHPKDYSDMDGY